MLTEAAASASLNPRSAVSPLRRVTRLPVFTFAFDDTMTRSLPAAVFRFVTELVPCTLKMSLPEPRLTFSVSTP